ncbi:MAG: MFS transporter, partial [Thermodesulfobacteriota bacterium]
LAPPDTAPLSGLGRGVWGEGSQAPGPSPHNKIDPKGWGTEGPPPLPSFSLQVLVFALVSAAFAMIYITQPVLPVIQQEFRVSAGVASLTVSAVILGMALANLPFGVLADRLPVRRIILVGGTVVALLGLFCALTTDLPLLVGARFLQGLFIPSLSTCVAAYLAVTLPLDRLNVVMGSYVSATVAGGLGGRLLGGWLHPPLHWRYALVTASVLLLAATWAAVRWLPEGKGQKAEGAVEGFLALISRPELRRIYLVAFGAFSVFSSVFNYLPFYLTGPPFHYSTQVITLLYLTYITGIIIGPLAGKLSNRLGSGGAMASGAGVFALALMVTLIKSKWALVAALIGVCAGFFTIHAAAAGALNRRLISSHGRANSLYVLFYYLGGAAGITAGGYAYTWGGWWGVILLGLLILSLPLMIGLKEREPS